MIKKTGEMDSTRHSSTRDTSTAVEVEVGIVSSSSSCAKARWRSFPLALLAGRARR